MYVVAIDVGLVNLGFVEVTASDDFCLESVLHAERVDLTQLPHAAVPLKECTLHHTNEVADRVQHFVQEYRERLERATYVLIERQPPGGLGHVEQLLFHFLRDKTTVLLLNPQSMHKHFNLPGGEHEYNHRKELTVGLARSHLEHLPGWTLFQDRLHDMADAMCFVVWWLHVKHTECETEAKIRESQRVTDARGHVTDAAAFFAQYKFNPTCVTAVVAAVVASPR